MPKVIKKATAKQVAAKIKTNDKKSAPAVAPVKKVAVKKATVKTAAAKIKTNDKKSAPAVAPVKKAIGTSAAKKTVVTNSIPKTASKPAKAAAQETQVKDVPLKKLRLSKTDKKFFYELLMHTRSQFGEQIKFHSDDALSTHKDSAGERAGMATHMADLGTDNYRHDFELGLMSDEVDVLEMIDEALQRLEDSEYGICLDCGEQIPRKRLEAKPYAKYCTKCKSKREAMDETYYHKR